MNFAKRVSCNRCGTARPRAALPKVSQPIGEDVRFSFFLLFLIDSFFSSLLFSAVFPRCVFLCLVYLPSFFALHISLSLLYFSRCPSLSFLLWHTHACIVHICSLYLFPFLCLLTRLSSPSFISLSSLCHPSFLSLLSFPSVFCSPSIFLWLRVLL